MEKLEETIMADEEINDDLSRIYQRVINYWKNKYREKFKECEDLKCDKEELEYHIETLNEKIEKIYEDRNENYRHIEYASQI